VEYVEILRARRVLFWYTAALLGCFVLTVISVYSRHAHVTGGGEPNGHENLSVIVAAATFGALIVATFLATGLNAEHATTAIIWTRPRSRETIAWRYIAVDLAAILAAYVILLAFIVAGLALFGLLQQVWFDPAKSLTAFLLGIGGAAMFYGLIAVAAARVEGHGARFGPLGWAICLILAAVTAAPVPELLHYLIVALNYLNPLAWLGNMGLSHSGSGSHVIPFSPPVRAAGAWLIAIVAIVASVKLWATREA
jgi:hypothetical protein